MSNLYSRLDASPSAKLKATLAYPVIDTDIHSCAIQAQRSVAAIMVMES